MRISTSFTSVSWIPSEAIPGIWRVPMALGIAHWDPPPPPRIDELEALRAADRFRFANRLEAWIEIEDGRITDAGYGGGSAGLMGSTTARLRVGTITLAGVSFPELRSEPAYRDDAVRFVQTVGGRTGFPLPRAVNRPPFVQFLAPPVWTTLAVTMHVDGRVDPEVVGASAFPRHWFYDAGGAVVLKSGVADWQHWSGDTLTDRSPWADHDEEVLVAAAESALERNLSALIMRGGEKPRYRRIAAAETLTEQGEPGDEVYLVLDGVLDVEVDGEIVAEVGPGAILGERAALEGGRRTSTLRARTRCRVAVAETTQLDRAALEELAKGHRRETAGVDSGGAPVA